MTDRTRQVVDLLLKAPGFLQALKEDPAALASRMGIPDEASSLLVAARDLIERCISPSAGALRGEGSNLQSLRYTPNSKRAAPSGATQDNTVATVGVIGLASVCGMLSAAAVVAAVAISKEER